MDTSPTGQFVLFGHFTYWTLCLLVISPTRHFAYGTFCLVNSSRTIWTFRLQDQIYKFGELLVSLCLLFEIWQVKSVRLMYDQSSKYRLHGMFIDISHYYWIGAVPD